MQQIDATGERVHLRGTVTGLETIPSRLLMMSLEPSKAVVAGATNCRGRLSTVDVQLQNPTLLVVVDNSMKGLLGTERATLVASRVIHVVAHNDGCDRNTGPG